MVAGRCYSKHTLLPMIKPSYIRVIAICVFQRDTTILVFEAFDPVKGTPFYRPLGGGVDPGETSEAAVIREIREEIGQEITALRLLGVLDPTPAWRLGPDACWASLS